MAELEPAPSDSLGLTTDALQPDSEKTTTLLAGFKGGLRVTLIPNTRIIEIHYRSADKNLAANVVNTLINTYIEQNFKTRFESTMQASDWLSKQLVDLEMKVQTSQEKLVQYQKQHEILGIDEKQNITTSKLDELNKELTAAESDRMAKGIGLSPGAIGRSRHRSRGCHQRRHRECKFGAHGKNARAASRPQDSGGPAQHAVRDLLSQSSAAQYSAERSGCPAGGPR